MREIKFRYRIKQRNHTKVRLVFLTLHDLEFNFYEDIIKNNWEVLSKDQFTGLKDKNDREIYEGDIVRFSRYWQDNFRRDVSFIVFQDAEFCLGNIEAFDYKLSILASEIEIIGNVWENPELLSARGD